MRQTFLVEITDHHDGGTQDTRRRGGCHPDRPGTGNINDGPDTNTGLHRTVEPGRQNVGQHRQVADFIHRLFTVGEFQKVEISIGHHDITRLPADPATHIDITIGTPGPRRVHRQAHTGILRFAAPAPPAGNIERDRYDIPDLKLLDVAALLDDLAGDFVPQNQPRLRGRAAAHHMLVRSANVGADHFQNDGMVKLPAIRRCHHRIGNIPDLDLAGPDIHHTSVAAHLLPPPII